MDTLFPTTEANYSNENVRTEGASLLDGFAMVALQGILANEHVSPMQYNFNADAVASRSYRLARAMMQTRHKL